jgi:hypothetical protein
MTYGTLDGTIAPSTSGTSKPAIVAWQDQTPTVDHGDPTSTGPAAPAVPGGGGAGGGGTTSVDTPSLSLFSKNIGELIKPLQDAQTRLDGMTAVPGGFAQAFTLRRQLVGEGGLQGSYRSVLGKVIETLTDVRNGVDKMAADYETTEEANTMKADAVAKAMPDLPGDLTSLGTSGAASA